MECNKIACQFQQLSGNNTRTKISLLPKSVYGSMGTTICFIFSESIKQINRRKFRATCHKQSISIILMVYQNVSGPSASDMVY